MILLSALFHAWQTAQKVAQTKKVQYLRIPAQLLLSLCLACLCLHATITHLCSPESLQPAGIVGHVGRVCVAGLHERNANSELLS